MVAGSRCCFLAAVIAAVLLFSGFFDISEDLFDIFENKLLFVEQVLHAHHAGQKISTHAIIFIVFLRMVRASDIDDELPLGAVQIDDVVTDCLVLVPALTIELLIAQVGPEYFASVTHRARARFCSNDRICTCSIDQLQTV